MVDQVSVLKLIVALIKLSKLHPDLGGFASALLWIYSLDSLRKCLDCQVSVLFAQLDPINPFIHVVGVLAENHVAQKEGSSLNQVFQTNESQLVFFLFRKLFELCLLSRWLLILFLLSISTVTESEVKKHVDLPLETFF